MPVLLIVPMLMVGSVFVVVFVVMFVVVGMTWVLLICRGTTAINAHSWLASKMLMSRNSRR